MLIIVTFCLLMSNSVGRNEELLELQQPDRQSRDKTPAVHMTDDIGRVTHK